MAAELPKTVAETREYRETSRYVDVMAFIRALQKVDPDLRVETFGTSVEGRALPLVIAGPKGVVNPETARASGKPIVFIFANIHAGEVEGKEAAQMLLRDLVSTHRKLRDELVLLIAPIYNADGNERIAKTNRTTQNGPPGGVGTRENAQGLDLNRDFMKLASPEARGLVRNVLHRWDPLLTVDLHTTNGSQHGYQLTYAPMLNPNSAPKLIDFSRATLLPQITAAMKKNHTKDTYYYGNFSDQAAPEKGWFSFEARPRFGNSYVGLRNRFVILSEAYSYIDFRARVEVTYEFLHEILVATLKHARTMQKLAREADAETLTLKTQGVQFELRPWKMNVPILWQKAPGEIVPVKMTDHGIFVATETSAVPYAYVVRAPDAVVANLVTHGIVVEKLNAETKLRVSRFAIEKVDLAEREFQQHRAMTLHGSWTDADVTFPAGTHIVRMQQPLARVAFYLLEPRSDDSLFTWNFFDVGDEAPVYKVMEPVALEAVVVQ